MRDPSTRRVATKLRQAGYLVSHMRVARWQRRGWTRVTRQHPLELAEELVDNTVPLLTGDVNTTARQYAKATAGEQESLRQLSDGELLKQAARELTILLILVYRSLQKHVGLMLAGGKVAELTVLINACSRCAARAVGTASSSAWSHRSACDQAVEFRIPAPFRVCAPCRQIRASFGKLSTW
jgi:hypothetical protein